MLHVRRSTSSYHFFVKSFYFRFYISYKGFARGRRNGHRVCVRKHRVATSQNIIYIMLLSTAAVQQQYSGGRGSAVGGGDGASLEAAAVSTVHLVCMCDKSRLVLLIASTLD